MARRVSCPRDGHKDNNVYTGMGCGDQEMFRNCADVQINSVVGSYPPGALGLAPGGLVYTGTAEAGLSPLVVTARVCTATEPYTSVEGGYDDHDPSMFTLNLAAACLL